MGGVRVKPLTAREADEPVAEPQEVQARHGVGLVLDGHGDGVEVEAILDRLQSLKGEPDKDDRRDEDEDRACPTEDAGLASHLVCAAVLHENQTSLQRKTQLLCY